MKSWIDVAKTVATLVGVYGGMTVLGAKLAEKNYCRGRKDGIQMCTEILEHEANRFKNEIKEKRNNSEEKSY